MGVLQREEAPHEESLGSHEQVGVSTPFSTIGPFAAEPIQPLCL